MKKYGRLDDDAWKNVADLKECFDSRYIEDLRV